MITAYKIVKYVDSELADAVSLEIGSMKLNIPNGSSCQSLIKLN